MKKILRHYIVGLIVCAIFLVTGCSSNPVTGTETGNPEITACCNAIHDFFVTNDAWVPSTYLTEGEQQLNPEWATTRWNSSIAKRKQSTYATVNPESTFTIVERTDTVIAADTSLVNDTLFVDTVIIDTVKKDYTVSKGGDSLLIARYIRYDSVVVQKTIIKKDTVFVKYNDTVWTSPPGDARTDNPAVSTAKPNYRVLRDSVTGTLSIVPVSTSGLGSNESSWGQYNKLLSPEIRSEVSYIAIAERTTSDGQKITEAYHYSTGQVPVSSGSDLSGAAPLSRGTISYASAGTVISLQIDFDAGSDLQFKTTGNNRIHALTRTTNNGNAIVDQISYGALSAPVHSDTVYLQHDQVFTDDTFEIQSTKYTCIRGPDRLDHRQNRMCSAYREIVLKNHPVKKMNLVVLPSVPVAKGERVGSGTVFCVLDCGNSRSGDVHGTVDYTAGTIAGTFTIDAAEYQFNYAMNNRVVELKRVK